MKRVLLTSICRPLGPRHGDGESVGYELLYGQVTRAQGLFSPRATHVHFSLEYVADNLDAPTTVLQYPSKRELIRELRRGYDIVGISFLLATFHRMKECVALVREHCPGAEIVLGGYGTVLSDDVLREFAEHVCREEGVAFMRRLLGEPEIEMPYRHPLVVSRLKAFGREVSRTGIVFAGLGCPNGCDFCCTSHFFKRRHIKLLPTGRDIYDVIRRYQELEPGMGIVILDEDFLLNRKRAMEFRDCVLEGGVALSIFAFASIRALSQFSIDELLEMGLDGFWIGYEGTESGYAKQDGRSPDELFPELRAHGISILTSMIVGFPYQTPEVIRRELDGLLALHPTFNQFLIYGPTPGTPFYRQVMDDGLLDPALAADNERYYRSCTGFNAMVKHPCMTAVEIEAAQERCFREDYERLGPSIYRSLEDWLFGYLKLRNSSKPILRRKAELFALRVRQAYPIFLAGRLLGPSRSVRRWIADLEVRVHDALGRPSLAERLQSVAAVGLAAWTGLTLKVGLFQHPKLIRHSFRNAETTRPARARRTWLRTARQDRNPASARGHRVAAACSASGSEHRKESPRSAALQDCGGGKEEEQ
jgi:haloalkane dehalogenase